MNDFQKIPFNDIVKFGQETMLDEGIFSVSWILGRFCNYKCSYCWPYANTDKPDHYSFDTYKHTIDEIKRQARANGFNKFHFSFSGGEPTAYKHLLELIEYYEDYKSPYLSIHMTTNLSPNKTWWDRWLSVTHVMDRRSITASYHAEFADETEFGDKCLMLMDNDTFVTVNQVMVPEMFNEYYDRCARLHERGINVTLKPQSDPTASFIVEGYTDEQMDKMQNGFPQTYDGEIVGAVKLYDSANNKYYIDQAERFNAFGFNRFKGWSCNAGYQSCIIRGNEVKRAYSCSDAPLGTITDGFTLFKTPSKCVTDTCVSSADNKIPKAKL